MGQRNHFPMEKLTFVIKIRYKKSLNIIETVFILSQQIFYFIRVFKFHDYNLTCAYLEKKKKMLCKLINRYVLRIPFLSPNNPNNSVVLVRLVSRELANVSSM